MMSDPIDDFFSDLLDAIDDHVPIDRYLIELLLRENELMIAPINDPTNLFGVMEDVDA